MDMYKQMIGNWTVFEWIIWLVLTVGATVGCYIWANRHKKSITPEGARQKTLKSLKKALPSDCEFSEDVWVEYGGKKTNIDIIVIGRFGMLLVKSFNSGVIIYGEPRKETWRLIERGLDKEFPNPLLELERDAELLRAMFAKNDIYKVPMEPLAVFAETAMTPELNLAGTKNAVILKSIPKFVEREVFQKNILDEQARARLLECLKAYEPTDKTRTLVAGPSDKSDEPDELSPVVPTASNTVTETGPVLTAASDSLPEAQPEIPEASEISPEAAEQSDTPVL